MKAEDFWLGGSVMADPLRGGNGHRSSALLESVANKTLRWIFLVKLPIIFFTNGSFKKEENKKQMRCTKESSCNNCQVEEGRKKTTTGGVWVSSCVVKEWDKTEGAVALGSLETTNKHLWWGCFCCTSKTCEKEGSVRGNGRMKNCIYL
ncbi:unnamed protein product [Lactuca saligna]|uniref:Uncharacterized protein n=1 Tax=Lactuca saligna TaxID=75948 RepID=A0AA35VZZ3_LACSI|nr:unnamed protein product [Lactuca saligna]CAI9272247.1 unnamed protein product [Lactuca saligna]